MTRSPRPFLTLVFFGASLCAGSNLSAQPQPDPAANRKVFANSVTPLPAQVSLNVQPSTAAQKKDQMELLFSLDVPADKEKKLEEIVASGKILSTEELDRDYSASQADMDKLTKWLKNNGFSITRVTRDRTGVYTKAPVDVIEKNLQVKMARVTVDGVTYNAARNAPSLPAEVGAGVHAIIGLQPFRHAHKHNVRMKPTEGNRATDEDGASLGPTTNIANQPPYEVQEVLRAYNADGLSLTGAGEKIAILIDTIPADADLKKFWSHHHLPVTMQNIEKINVSATHLPPREGEETLDVEWTTGIAPGAIIRVYAAGSLSFVDLDKALDQIIEDRSTQSGMHQLSISLGLGERYMPGGAEGEVQVQHQKFLRLVATGVNVFVSSGDAGSMPDDSGHGSGLTPEVEYESSDSLVTAVGGSSLVLNSDGSVKSEEVWPGSGGGRSIYFERPSWQKGVGVPPDGNDRLVPDVCLAADPNFGAYVFFQGQAQQYGGTSWSAPVWAGFCALINEARAKAGKPSLPLLNPLLYSLIGTTNFRDITVGSNGPGHVFDATAGYDMATGVGSPNVKELVKTLTK